MPGYNRLRPKEKGGREIPHSMVLGGTKKFVSADGKEEKEESQGQATLRIFWKKRGGE